MNHCDCESPTAFWARTITARVTHRCGECFSDIKPRERYLRSSGIFDGAPFSEATCLVCVAWSDGLRAAIREHKVDVCDCWPYGGLGDALSEYAEELPNVPIRLAREAKLAEWRRANATTVCEVQR